MLSKKAVAGISLGAITGAGQTLGFRMLDDYLANQYLSSKQKGKSPAPPFLMKQAGEYGSTSLIVNGAVSATELTVGVVGALRDKGTHHPAVQAFLISAGSAGIMGAIGSAVQPPAPWTNAVKVDPGRPYQGSGSQNRSPSISGAASSSSNLARAVVA